MRRRFVIAAGVLILILVAGAASAYYVTKHRFGGTKLGSSSGFVSTQTVAPPKPDAGLVSPMFGVGPEHLHVGVGRVRPPFHLDWTANGISLIEFPPAVAFHHLYYATLAGKLKAVSTTDGGRLWGIPVGRCEAAGPAVSAYKGGTVFETFLNRTTSGACNANPASGLILAVSAGPSHAALWRRNLGASESSPTVVGSRLYFGTAEGKVYCLRVSDGKTLWSYQVGGPVKGAITYDRGKVFFGSYDGHVYALTAATGKLVWTSPSFGHFYSTPAVAYSRVYIGSTDHSVYAFDERTGALVWSRATGSYVYASPAVYSGRVFIGSYDHVFYALDAATGSIEWTFTAAGPISGSAAVVGGLVYFSHLGARGARHTYALDTRTGRKVWSWNDGAFAAVATDGAKLYLVGWGRIYAFSPRRPHHHREARTGTVKSIP
jgi:outer membrane protein assembly factor BamB